MPESQPEFPDMPGWSNAAKIARIDYLIGMKSYHQDQIETIIDEIHELRDSMIDD